MPSLCACSHGTADPQPTHALQHWQHIMSPQGLSSKRLQQLPKKAPLEQLSQFDLCPSLLSELAQPWSVSQPCATGSAELEAFHCHPWRRHPSLAQEPPQLGQKKPQKIRKGHQNACTEQQQHKEQRLGALAAQDKSKNGEGGGEGEQFPTLPKKSCTSKASDSGEISAASHSHFPKEPRGIQRSPHTRDSGDGRNRSALQAPELSHSST